MKAIVSLALVGLVPLLGAIADSADVLRGNRLDATVSDIRWSLALEVGVTLWFVR
jgi:hypothetical protein